MSQFESIDRVLKKGRLELQEVKKKMGGGSNSSSDNNVRTNTNPNETIFGDNKNKKQKKFNNKTKTKTKMDLSKPIKDPWFTDKNDYPDGYESPKNKKPLTKHQKARQQVIQKRTQYGLKPDSRGVYKPTKPGLKSSLTNQIGYSSTPPKPGAKKNAEALKKFNQQMRKSKKYSGNENAARVKKIVDRVAKNQKIDKTKSGLVSRLKDIAYGKNPYKPKFGSVSLNMQKKYDTQMLNYGGRMSPLMTKTQLAKLKTKIASKPAEKTMTYLAPAGSGRPVPLKTRRIKTSSFLEPPKVNPSKVTTNFTTVNKGFKNAIKNKKGIAKILSKIPKRGKIGLALAGGALLYGALKGDKKKPDGGPITIPVNKKNYKMVPANLTLQSKPTPLPFPAINPSTNKEYTPAQGGQPQSKFNKFIAKTAQTKSNPNLYKPKNTPKPPTTSTSAFNPNYDASKVASQAKKTQRSSNVNRNKFLP